MYFQWFDRIKPFWLFMSALGAGIYFIETLKRVPFHGVLDTPYIVWTALMLAGLIGFTAAVRTQSPYKKEPFWLTSRHLQFLIFILLSTWMFIQIKAEISLFTLSLVPTLTLIATQFTVSFVIYTKKTDSPKERNDLKAIKSGVWSHFARLRQYEVEFHPSYEDTYNRLKAEIKNTLPQYLYICVLFLLMSLQLLFAFGLETNANAIITLDPEFNLKILLVGLPALGLTVIGVSIISSLYKLTLHIIRNKKDKNFHINIVKLMDDAEIQDLNTFWDEYYKKIQRIINYVERHNPHNQSKLHAALITFICLFSIFIFFISYILINYNLGPSDISIIVSNFNLAHFSIYLYCLLLILFIPLMFILFYTPACFLPNSKQSWLSQLSHNYTKNPNAATYSITMLYVEYVKHIEDNIEPDEFWNEVVKIKHNINYTLLSISILSSLLISFFISSLYISIQSDAIKHSNIFLLKFHNTYFYEDIDSITVTCTPPNLSQSSFRTKIYLNFENGEKFNLSRFINNDGILNILHNNIKTHNIPVLLSPFHNDHPEAWRKCEEHLLQDPGADDIRRIQSLLRSS